MLRRFATDCQWENNSQSKSTLYVYTLSHCLCVWTLYMYSTCMYGSLTDPTVNTCALSIKY